MEKKGFNVSSLRFKHYPKPEKQIKYVYNDDKKSLILQKILVNVTHRPLVMSIFDFLGQVRRI